MAGFEKNLLCPTKGIITYVKFLPNQGLLAAAAIDDHISSVYVWEINKGSLLYEPMSLPINE